MKNPLDITAEPFEGYGEFAEDSAAFDIGAAEDESEEEIRRRLRRLAPRVRVVSRGATGKHLPKHIKPWRKSSPDRLPSTDREPGGAGYAPTGSSPSAPPEVTLPPEGGDYTRWVQDSLNRLLGLWLPVNGVMGPASRSAVRGFQRRMGLRVTGIVGPDTEQALLAALESLDAEATEPAWEGEVDRSNPAYIRWVQRSLNQILGLRLAVDGVTGPQTRSAIRSFQRRRRLKVNGRVGPQTERSLLAAGASPPPTGITPVPGATLNLERAVAQNRRYAQSLGWQQHIDRIVSLLGFTDMTPAERPFAQAVARWQSTRGLSADGAIGPATWRRMQQDLGLQVPPSIPPTPDSEALAWGARVSAEFRNRVRQIGAEFGFNPNFLMAVMTFESGETFSPSIRNRSTGATGLIQFLPSTARRLGTTTDELAAMTAEQQLDYVARYFKPYRGRLKTIEDVYMAVLWPRAVGAANDAVLFAAPSRAYELNRGLDRNGDGRVTKEEATAPVRAKLSKGLKPGFVA